jgi:hypothetical protein
MTRRRQVTCRPISFSSIMTAASPPGHQYRALPANFIIIIIIIISGSLVSDIAGRVHGKFPANTLRMKQRVNTLVRAG